MQAASEMILVLVVLTDLMLLGTSRIRASIRLVAIQGTVLGLLPLVVHLDGLELHHIITAGMGLCLRGVLFPWLLTRAVREAQVPKTGDSALPYSLAMTLGAVIAGYSMWLGTRLELVPPPASNMIVPVALTTILVGLLLLVVRRRALSQVIGYLVLENGIYIMGTGLDLEDELIVQLGVMLDVFAGLFIMGIAIYHISNEFDRLDVDHLSSLQD